MLFFLTLPPAVVLSRVLLHLRMFVVCPHVVTSANATVRPVTDGTRVRFQVSLCAVEVALGPAFFRLFRFSRVSFRQPSVYRRRCVILAVDRVVLYNTSVSRFWSALSLLTEAWSGIQPWPRNEGGNLSAVTKFPGTTSFSSVQTVIWCCLVYVNHTLLTRYDICNISLNVLVCSEGAVNHTLRLWNVGRYERFFIPSLMYFDLHQGRRRFQGHLRPR